MRHAFVAFILLSSCLLLFGAGISPDPENLPNLHEPRTDILTAGQPTETGFREVASMGIKTVLNVLPERECWSGEQDFVKAQNMKYVAFPFETSGFKVQTFRRFGELMQKEPKPMLIHCSTGNHVGGLWFGYRALVEKAPLGIALKEARNIGLKKSLEDTLLNWVVEEREALQRNEKIGR